jgi:hypothetical protein
MVQFTTRLLHERNSMKRDRESKKNAGLNEWNGGAGRTTAAKRCGGAFDFRDFLSED